MVGSIAPPPKEGPQDKGSHCSLFRPHAYRFRAETAKKGVQCSALHPLLTPSDLKKAAEDA